MAFADLSPTQAVSFTDAQSSGFALKAGQSHVTSNQCMTKSDALAKYVLNATSMNSFSDNQLVPKNNWATGVVGNAITVYLSNPSADATCGSHSYGLTVYSTNTSISNGITLYSDANMSSVYSSRLNHYDAGGNRLFTINTSGVVSILGSCVPAYSWAGQRGSLTCVGGQVAVFNPSNITVFTSNPILQTGIYLYLDAQLSQPYTYANVIRIGLQIWYVDGSGLIYSYADVGDPC